MHFDLSHKSSPYISFLYVNHLSMLCFLLQSIDIDFTFLLFRDFEKHYSAIYNSRDVSQYTPKSIKFGGKKKKEKQTEKRVHLGKGTMKQVGNEYCRNFDQKSKIKNVILCHKNC